MGADVFHAPALRKAVVDCTQAHDVAVPCETQQLLQGYLEDRKTVDAVYAMLLRRAVVNQSSGVVVEKAVALMKQYIERYTPAPATLHAIRELCTTILHRQHPSPGARRAAEYLLRKLRALLPPPDSPSLGTSKEGKAAPASPAPLRRSTADELLFATAQLDTRAQPSAAPPSSTAHALQRRHAGQRAPALKLTTALQGYLHGHPAAEQGGGGTLSSRDIISSILEGSEAVVAEQVRDIVAATMTRQAASWPGQPAGAAAPAVGARLYSPPVYCGGEPLALDEAEVAGCVALVCGPGAGDDQGGTVPLPRSWGQEDSLWRPSAMGHPSLGQMCTSVLVKLLLDLWMHAPPPASSALAARLLATCQASPRPDLRCRAHDLLYNLHLHSALLADLHHPNGAQQLEALEQWLRGLLYAAVHNMLAAREGSEEVWRAALGVLLQLHTHCGHLAAPLAAEVPPAVAAAFLDRCQQYGWSQELYCHLVELAAAALLAAARALPPPGAEGSGEGSGSGCDPPVLDEWEVAALAGGALEDALRAFGGLPHLLHHFCNCPTAASRGHLLRVMLHAVLPAGTAPALMGPVAALLLAPTAAEALQTALRLPVPGLAAHLQSCLTRASAAAVGGASADGGDPSADVDASLLLRVLGALEAAALSTTGCPEAAAVEAALHALPAGATDPLVAWQLLRDVRGPALAHPVARRVVVLRLYRLIDATIAQHQVSSLPQLAAVGLLPQPPSASAVLQGAAVPQSLLADLLLAGGPPGAIAAFVLVQRLLAALRHRVLTAARGRDAAATTLRWHLAAASATTWRTLVQWLQHAPGGIPRPLQRAIAGEVMRLPVTLQPPKALPHPPPAWAPGCEEELPLSALLVAGRATLSEKALHLLGPLLAQVLQLLPPSPPHLQHLHRGCYVRLRPPPSAAPPASATSSEPASPSSVRGSREQQGGGQVGGGALWAPWSETEAEQRVALVVLLLGHWQLAPAEVAGSAAGVVVRRWLEDGDPRVRYVGGRCVQLQLLATQPEQYWASLRQLVLQAQRLVQCQLLDNPLLQITALHEMKLV